MCIYITYALSTGGADNASAAVVRRADRPSAPRAAREHTHAQGTDRQEHPATLKPARWQQSVDAPARWRWSIWRSLYFLVQENPFFLEI